MVKINPSAIKSKIGLPKLLTKTRCTYASEIRSFFLLILCDIIKEVFVIDFTKEVINNSSSKYADNLY